MAKQSKSVSFKNATITLENDGLTITEYSKDDSTEYDLVSVLKQWCDIDGISLSIKQDSELNSEL